MNKAMIILLAACLSACDAEGNLGREESPFWHKRTPLAEKVAYFKPRCAAYGFEDGSAEMSKCIQDEIQTSSSDASQRVRAAVADMNARNEAQRTQRLQTNCNVVGRSVMCY